VVNWVWNYGWSTLLAALTTLNGPTDPFRATYLGRSEYDFLSRAAGEAGAQPDGVPDLQFHLEGLHAGKQIQDLRVHYPPYNYNWSTSSTNWWATAMVFDSARLAQGPRREDGQTTLHGPIVAAPAMELFITEYPGEYQADQFEVLVLYTDGSVQPVGEGLAVYVASDLAGHFVGVVTYGGPGGGRVGRPDVTVTATAITPGEKREWTTTTDAEGLFAFPVADLLGSLTRGSITFVARKGEENASVEVDLSDVPLQLTPRPEQVDGRPARPVDLTGRWRFAPDPPEGFPTVDFDDLTWEWIHVPGHWVQQGFHSEPGVGGYRRAEPIPAGWKGQRVKLSFDGVYSGAEVWVNGARVGSHEGGATPFEFDVTDFVRCGQPNLFAVRVTEQTEAARLDKMSQYAHFPLTGLYRGARLFAVPPVHLARLHVETPSAPPGAMLRLLFAVVNESEIPAGNVTVRFTLTDPNGQTVPLAPAQVEVSLPSWGRVDQALEMPVANPIRWDAEHPNLYTLTAEVIPGNTPPSPGEEKTVRVRQRIGFRQVGIRGSELHVNGQRVTLRGTCRHDAWPPTGRAVTPDLLRRDFELMREANLNAVRTSHYPPAPELLDLADEMGFYVEEEAPFCWVHQEAERLSSFPTILQRTAEMLERDRSHPSVIFWSQANESAWGRSFELCVRWMRRLDPTRPWAADGTTTLDIATYHNPTLLQGVLDSAKADRPVLAGEALCIFQGIGPNGRELEVDPGLRDYYVVPLLPVREAIVQSPAHLGTMIWCWADDVFQIPDGEPQNQVDEYGQRARPEDVAVDLYRQPGQTLVGYPPWGVVDGWRRKRPEWWLVKKLYTPVKIAEAPLSLPPPGEPLRIEVENRYDHTNLSELRAEWRLGDQSGPLHLDVPPRSRGVMEIPLSATETQRHRENVEKVAQSVRLRPSAGQTNSLRYAQSDELGLWLEFHDRRGWLVDAYHLPLNPATPQPRNPGPQTPPPSTPVSPPTVSEEAETLVVRGEQFEIAFDRTTGHLRSAAVEGVPVLLEGPRLHVLPWADAFAREPDPQTWTLRDLRAGEQGSGGAGEQGNLLPSRSSLSRSPVRGGGVVVTVEGAYAGFEGRYELAMDGAGNIQATYHFTRTGPELAVRELGLRFAAPKRCDTLRWKRQAEFSVYPDDHIGRPVGEARPFPPSGFRDNETQGRRGAEAQREVGNSLGVSAPSHLCVHWAQDCTPAGSNDFRSTKRNLLSGSLTDPDGVGVGVDSNGEQHLRAAVEGDRIAVYVNDWYGGTNCRGFFEWQGNYGTGKTLAQGTAVEGTLSLHLLGFHSKELWGNRGNEAGRQKK